MKKRMYESPVLELFEVTLERKFLASVEKMRTIDGSWDEDE